MNTDTFWKNLKPLVEEYVRQREDGVREKRVFYLPEDVDGIPEGRVVEVEFHLTSRAKLENRAES